MRISLRPTGGLDLATPALIVGGFALIVASLVAAAVLLTPAIVVLPIPVAGPSPTLPASIGRPSIALSADRVASVLIVDAATGAASAARSGDHVDVLGYFSREIIGSESLTRVLLQDVPVLTVDRSGASVALTLEVPHDGALLLQEAGAIGARPFIALRSAQSVSGAQREPGSFSDTDLAQRLAGGG